MNSDNFPYIRKLMIALTASGVLNILLISLFFYWMIKDTPPSPYFEQKPALKEEQQAPLASERGNAELIHYYRSLSFDQLVAQLNHHRLIENGYSQRDVALACLVTFHHFDLERALVGFTQPEQKRSIVYGQLKNGLPAMITVYPGLSDEQFQAVIHFANTEKWPLTSKGLFWQLKKMKNLPDSSLEDAFSITPEFLSVELLFNRAESSVSKAEIQSMLLEGTWLMLSQFAEQQKLVQDLSPARRQRFLLEYIDYKSPAAAHLMLKLDGEFALKKLDDRHVITLLGLLKDKNPQNEKFALDLLSSPRSDGVWKTAAAKLYQYAGETAPEKNLHHLAIKRFIPGQMQENTLSMEKSLVTPPMPAKAPVKRNSTEKMPVTQLNKPTATIKKEERRYKEDRLYIVQEGDSLWKISRKFNVDMDILRNHNKLKSDALKPGTPIRIPYG